MTPDASAGDDGGKGADEPDAASAAARGGPAGAAAAADDEGPATSELDAPPAPPAPPPAPALGRRKLPLLRRAALGRLLFRVFEASAAVSPFAAVAATPPRWMLDGPLLSRPPSRAALPCSAQSAHKRKQGCQALCVFVCAGTPRSKTRPPQLSGLPTPTPLEAPSCLAEATIAAPPGAVASDPLPDCHRNNTTHHTAQPHLQRACLLSRVPHRGVEGAHDVVVVKLHHHLGLPQHARQFFWAAACN